MLGELPIDAGDAYSPSKDAKFRTVITPRVILITDSGIIPIIMFNNWGALPGGKMKVHELEGNLLAQGAFPNLGREVWEECEIDISVNLVTQSACLGLAEVTAVDEELRQITKKLTPIFITKIDKLPQKNWHSRYKYL